MRRAGHLQPRIRVGGRDETLQRLTGQGFQAQLTAWDDDGDICYE